MEAVATAPPRSLHQRLDALREANRIRSARAKMKRELKARTRKPQTMIDHPDCATMHIIDFLVAIPGVGQSRANRFLRDSLIAPSKTLGGLTDRQRTALKAWLH
jgi:hypothetical protein